MVRRLAVDANKTFQKRFSGRHRGLYVYRTLLPDAPKTDFSSILFVKGKKAIIRRAANRGKTPTGAG